MPMNDAARRNWISIQERHPSPVGPIGVRIDGKGERASRARKEESIDEFMKR